ncbi:cytochrome c oxidase assembly protein [Microbacterium sp.]|uniref:cytochrome c oxidase assembly protein n=1 Tax=Microbacterium sp. TaxID=51671 RepID=UPI00260C1A98|nr:cytochrome c oxidase assembly protein [Microbacterium sp.]
MSSIAATDTQGRTTVARRRSRPGLVALLGAGFVVLVVAVPLVVTVLLGEAPYELIHLSYPGVDVATVSTVLTSGAVAGSVVSVGALVHLLFLRDAPASKARRIAQGFEVRVLRVAAGVWALCACGLILFQVLDANGTPLERLAIPGAFAFLYEASTEPMAWTISFVAAMIVFFVAFFADRWTSLLIPLWAAVIAVLAPVVSGQVLVGPDHDFGGDAAVFQTLAVFVFFGAVAVAAVRVASGRLVAPLTLRRLFLIGAVALPVMVGVDVILAVFTLAGTPVTGSLTGWLLLARGVCVLIVIGATATGWWLWRRARLRAHHLSALFTIAGLAVAGWVGVAVAMTRQPPPQYFVPTSISQVFMGFEVPDAPTLDVLVTQWRPNLLFLGIAVTAITVYLLAVRTLQRRGDTWPAGRTVAWVGGWAVVVVATSSGFGKYSAPDFGVHMIVHMSLNMLAPGLLVLGGVVTLLLRATTTTKGAAAGFHDWLTWVLQWRVLHVIYNPLVVFVLFIGSYYGLYLTGIFGEFMRFHWAHQAMNLHFLIVGYLYYSLIIGVDRPPRPLPHIGKLGFALAAMPFHAFFGIILMTGNVLIAENFYLYLGLPWTDLPAQQYLAGGVAWAGGEIPLMIVITILAIQWGRQDAREARRKDRHLDTGRDTEFDAYNQMLQRLADRDTATTGPRPPAQKDTPS